MFTVVELDIYDEQRYCVCTCMNLYDLSIIIDLEIV